MSRPITQKAKSPLKQTVEMVSNKQKSYGTGEQLVEENVKGADDNYDGSGGYMSSEDWEKWYNSPEGADYRSKYNMDGSGKEQTVTKVIPGKTVTTNTREAYTPQTKDSYTGITPWENRFNMRTARQSERFSRNEAKRDLRRQANEAARRARRDEGMSMAESLKLRQGIMKGDDKRYSELYNTSRGLDADQKRAYKTDMQYNQFNKGVTRGEEFTGTARDMNIYDVGTAKGKTTLANYKNADPNFKLELGANTSTSKANEGAANVPATNKVNGSGSKGKTLIGARNLNVGSAPQVNVPKVDLVKAGADAKANAAVAEYEKFNPKTSEKPAKAPKAKKQPKEKGGYTRKEIRQMRRENADRAVLEGNEAGSTRAAERRVKRAGRKALNQEAKEQRRLDRAMNKVAKAGDSRKSRKITNQLEKQEVAPEFDSSDPMFRGEGKTPKQMQRQIKKDQKQRKRYERKSERLQAKGKIPEGEVLVSPRDERNRAEFEARRDASPAQMRYQSNVGIKQRSPMKKGYFKNK